MANAITHADFNDDDFFRKVRRFAGNVPFVPDALAMYYAMVDPQTPWRAKAAIAGALVYFVCPADAIPDVVPGLGFVDDAAVIASVIVVADAHITNEHRRQAKDFLS